MDSPAHRPVPDSFAGNRFLLKRQFLKLFGNNLRVYDQYGKLAMFVHQKSFKLREDIRVYSDETKSREILSIKAQKIIDFSAAYDVVDSQTGIKYGALRRKGWSSLVRDNWQVLNANDVMIGEVTEDQMALALVRRFLTSLVPQGYDLVGSGRKLADFQQRFNPFVYHLDIDFSMDPQQTINRRMTLATAILLATIEGRQS